MHNTPLSNLCSLYTGPYPLLGWLMTTPLDRLYTNAIYSNTVVTLIEQSHVRI